MWTFSVALFVLSWLFSDNKNASSVDSKLLECGIKRVVLIIMPFSSIVTPRDRSRGILGMNYGFWKYRRGLYLYGIKQAV